MTAGTGSPLSVLIVDDDPVDRRSVKRALGDRYTLIEAEDGEQARQVLNLRRPDCILLDYNILGTDTLALLDVLRQRAPIIMLTGQGDPAVAVAAMKAGAMDYLSKNDFSPDSLDRTIRMAIEKSDRQRKQLESRARLRKEYEHEKERRLELEGSLRIARDIQQNLLPSAAPLVAGFDIAGICVTADATGGDFFDYLLGADGTLGLVVGDISGHGIGPALLAAETRAYIRALTCVGSDVGQIATTVNRLLWQDTSGDRFATLFLAWLNPVARTLTYAAAAHCAYISHASGQYTELDSQSAPLGLFDDTELPSDQTVSLQSGDVLLLATDGLFDVGARDHRNFGKDRCLGLIHVFRSRPAEKIIDAVLHAARTFAHRGPLPDDLTIVIAKIL